MKTTLISPQTPVQWQKYFDVRYQVLRAPWQQPLGSERDQDEDQAFHLMAEAADGTVLAVGRCQLIDANCAQVRYMAVSPAAQGQGLGQQVLAGLELWAQQQGAQQVRLNARENAIGFYRKQGYRDGAAQPPLFDIPHLQMSKTLSFNACADQWPSWLTELQQTWHQTIPLSAFMQLQVQAFDGKMLTCQAPLAPNKNLHQSMFAGSIYSLATLTGWGMVYLQLKDLALQGDIVLADAQIRYLAPLLTEPTAQVNLVHCKGDLAKLSSGRKARQQLLVQVFSATKQVAEFVGHFVVIPKAAISSNSESQR